MTAKAHRVKGYKKKGYHRRRVAYQRGKLICARYAVTWGIFFGQNCKTEIGQTCVTN